MNLKDIFFGPEDKPHMAEEISWRFKVLKAEVFGAEPKKLSAEALLSEIERLQKEVKAIKRDGISMWNYKAAIPKIFDIVDGAFVVMIEVVKKLGEKE